MTGPFVGPTLTFLKPLDKMFIRPEGEQRIPVYGLGFTLLQVLVVLVVLGILAAIAVPRLSAWIPSARLKSAAQDLLLDLQLAKASAIGKGSFCTVTFYQPIGAETFDYVTFMDTDQDLEWDTGEVILAKRLWGRKQYPGISLDKSKGGGDGVSLAQNDDGLPAIAFRPSGIPVNNAGGLGMGSIYLRNEKGKTARVVISSAGNIRLEY